MIDDSGIPRVAIGAGLVLRSVEREEDIPALAEFNRTVHGEDGLDAFTTELILRHPRTSPRHWFYIEDTESGRIAASLCLLPWDLTYGGVPIRSAEMGIVGTGEGYRGRGLNRILVDRFGYEYAVPLDLRRRGDLRRNRGRWEGYRVFPGRRTGIRRRAHPAGVLGAARERLSGGLRRPSIYGSEEGQALYPL